mgnify:CR=1 FL=1
MSLQPTLAAIATALVFPHRFYRERRPDPGDAGPIVLGVGLVSAVAVYAVFLLGAVVVSLQHASADTVGLLADLDPGIYALGLLAPVAVVANWLLVGFLLHVAVTLGGGDGEYADTLAVVGWATPATLLAMGVTAVGFLLALWGNPLQMSYEAKLVAVAPGVGLAATVGGLLSLLWQGYCWPPGLRRVHAVDGGAPGRATALTLAIGAIGLLLTL